MIDQGALGRVYEPGEVIVRQGDVGDCMYVIQDGEVEILAERDGTEALLRVAGRNEILGEMAIFEHQRRSATMRARSRARVLTLDKRNFLRRINEDPSLAFNIVETMSRRVRELSQEIVELKAELKAAGVESGPHG
jgi:CRP-like cAMP-binding protein